MINLFNEHYVYGIGFSQDSTDRELYGYENTKTLCLKCKSNKRYTIICKQSELTSSIGIASSNKYYDRINNYDGFQSIYNIVISDTGIVEYSTENLNLEVNSMLITLPKNYNSKVLIVESPMDELLDVLNISEFTDDFLNEFFFDEPWLLHKRFIQSILCNCINKYSSEYDIKYVQDSILQIYSSSYSVTSLNHTYGVFDDDLKNLVIQQQRERNLIYSNGTVYPDLELVFDNIRYSRGIADE
jgi:hypothetical protein